MTQLYPQWRDDQAQATFPFADAAVPTTFENRKLPYGVVLDALLHVAGSTGGYYLDTLVFINGTAEFTVNDATQSPVATGTWLPSLPDTSVVPLHAVRDGSRAGVLVVDPATLQQTMTQWGNQTHAFRTETSAFVPTTWMYAEFFDPDELAFDGEVIRSQGDLYVVGEDGVRLTCDEVDGRHRITVHAIGDPLAKRQACGTEFVAPRFVTELVFQHGTQTLTCGPGEQGETFLVVASKTRDVDSALRLVNSPGKIQLGFATAPPSSK